MEMKMRIRNLISLLFLTMGLLLFSVETLFMGAASAQASEVTKTNILKVDVSYKRLMFSLNPAVFNSSFVRNYEIGFKGHYDESDYGDPSSFCNIPSSTIIKNKNTVVQCIVDLSTIPIEVMNQITAKGVIIDWVVRGNYEGSIGSWSDPYSLQLYKFPSFSKVASKSPSATKSWPSGAIARCKDGTYSFQAQHRGACSRHGGVAVWKS